MPSPTSGSPAKTLAAAPPWVARLLVPLFARQLAERYRGLAPPEAAARMQAELGAVPPQLVDAVLARLAPPAQPAPRPPSAWVLVAANVLPLAGVLFWGWDAFALLVLFWMENVVIGALNALKMLAAEPTDVALWAAKLFLVPFFCLHYGMFTAAHGVFVLSFFGAKRYDVEGFAVWEPALRAARDHALWLPLAVLAASHLFSFGWNYLHRGEFRRTPLTRLMAQPYGRVVVLHVTIIAGGFAAALLGSPLWALALLIALKIALDLRAHLKEHSAP